VPFDAEALSQLFALERHREPFQEHGTGEAEDEAVLVKGLDLGGAVVRVEVETLRGAAVEEFWTAPRRAL